jgi:ABC-type amino acid transport substrate-binding protein
VKIAYQVGGASETIMRKLVPQATLLGLKNVSEVVLSLQAGQADAAVSTTLVVLGQLQKEPTLGTFGLPTPEFSLPAYVGMRPDADPRMREYIAKWAEWNSLIGVFDQMMKDNLVKIGVTNIPDNVHF